MFCLFLGAPNRALRWKALDASMETSESGHGKAWVEFAMLEGGFAEDKQKIMVMIYDD